MKTDGVRAGAVCHCQEGADPISGGTQVVNRGERGFYNDRKGGEGEDLWCFILQQFRFMFAWDMRKFKRDVTNFLQGYRGPNKWDEGNY